MDIAYNNAHLYIIVTSFVELIRYIFTIPNIKMFLSERLNQDPLEGFFGKQRQCGGGSDHPTVHQFINNTSSLHMQKSAATLGKHL